MSDVVVLCARYSCNPGDSTLVDELVGELERRGRTVTVVAAGEILGTMAAIEKARTRRRHLFPATRGTGFVKYVLVWPRAMKALHRELRSSPAPTMLVAFAPLTVLFPMVIMALLKRPRTRVAVVFDLFPGHQVQVGRIPYQAEGVLKRIEAWLLKGFEVITGMTPKNVAMIRQYYVLSGVKPKIKVMPPWGYRGSKSRPMDRNPSGEVRLVFGGQLVAGRNMEALLDVVRLMRKRGVPLRLTVFSSGEEFERLKSRFSGDEWGVEFKQRVERVTYQRLLEGFHVGAIVTDPRVAMPTFPSKLIDYLNAGLRCFCLIESASDIESVIANRDCLHVNHFSTDPNALSEAEAFFRRCLVAPPMIDSERFRQFSVAHAATLLCEEGCAGTNGTVDG